MFQFNNPFKVEGNWYKGNLHTHTTNSDGALSPSEAVCEYEKEGYHFLAITDHWRLTELKGTSNMLLIRGEEVDCPAKGVSFHLIALDIKEEIPHPTKDDPKLDPQELIRRIKSQGGQVILAHPYWSALSTMDMLSIEGYIGVEVFNTGCLFEVDKGYSMTHWDDLLIRGRNVFGFAVDDAHWHHREHQPKDACQAWIMVKAKSLSTEEIMDSIRKGLFYASWGPKIKDLSIEGDRIYVSTSPVKSISFVAPNGRGERFSAVKSRLIEDAEYKIRGEEKYVRVQCIDEAGRMAWTNAIFFS